MNAELDDYLLGLYSNSNTGIYNNSRIGSPSCVESIVSVLLMNLTRVKQQNTVLQELFKDYEYFKSLSIEQNKKLDSLGKKLKSSEDDKLKLNSLLTDLKNKNTAIGQERDLNEQEVKNKLDKIKLLEKQIQELQEEKERYAKEKQEHEEKLKQEQEEREKEQQREIEREKELSKARERVTITEIDEQVRQQQELNNFIADLSRTPSFKNAKIQPEPIQSEVEPFPTVEEHSHSESVSESDLSPSITKHSTGKNSTKNLKPIKIRNLNRFIRIN